MTQLRVLVAEDHALVRAGFRALLAQLDWVKVVSEAADGPSALRQIAAEQPDVVLMDIAMPGLSGLEATARVMKDFPRTKVLILSMYANEEYVRQALGAGAVGYLLKDGEAGELELALRAIARGDGYLSPAVSRSVIAAYAERTGDTEPALALLTFRQRQILLLIAEGHTTKAIAQKLGVGVKTVETHRSQLMERLGIHNVAGLVRFAIRAGLLPPER